jgi:diacylglycerol O-acyltransferase / wax synthase
MERMSPLDATFLYVEDGVTHMHIASCAVFEGPAPPYDRVVAAIAGKLDLIPRYRQVVRFVPLQLGRPVWVDDPHFRLEYHVRHTALPPPGGDAELRALMGRVMSQELDRHRPLWETWMIEGMHDGRWGLITKIHHCMADGVAGTDLLAVVLDDEPAAPRSVVEVWRPAAQPSDLRLVADAVVELALIPFMQLQALGDLTRTPRRSLTQLREIATGMRSYAGSFEPTRTSSLVGGIGPHRRWTWVSVDLDDAKFIRHSFGGTVNDVIVTVVTSGLRQLLLHRGEPLDGLAVRSLIPVSIRSDEAHNMYDNQVTAMFADLPVAIDDPIERLAAVQEHMAMLKASHQADAGIGLTALSQFAPSAAIAFAERSVMRVLRHVPQHSIATVATNVPGPQQPLYLAGREMLEYLPFVPIAPGVRVGIAIVSYNGRLAFGITGDFDTAPDIDVVAHGIEDAIAELVGRADRVGDRRSSRRRRQTQSA